MPMSDIFSDSDSSDDDVVHVEPPTLKAEELESYRADGRLNDKKFVMHLLRTRLFYGILQYLPHELQDDAQVVEAAIFRVSERTSNSGLISGREYYEVVNEIQYASERLRNDVSFIQSIRARLRKGPFSKLEMFDTLIPQTVIRGGPDSIRELSLAIRKGDLKAYEAHKMGLKPYMADYILHLIVRQKPQGWEHMFIDIKRRYPGVGLNVSELKEVYSNDVIFEQVVPLIRGDRDMIQNLSALFLKEQNQVKLVYLASGSSELAFYILEEAFKLAQWSNVAKHLKFDDEDDDLVMVDHSDAVISDELDGFINHLITALTMSCGEPPKKLGRLAKSAIMLNAVSSLAALLKLKAPIDDMAIREAVPHVACFRLLIMNGASVDELTLRAICQKDAVDTLKVLYSTNTVPIQSGFAFRCVFYNADRCLSFLLEQGVGCVVSRNQFKEFHGASSVKTSVKLQTLQDIMNVEDFTEFPCRCLPCKHVFNGAFLRTYLNENIPDYQATYTVCPTCKAEISEIELMSSIAASHWDKNEILAESSEKKQKIDLKRFDDKNAQELQRLKQRIAEIESQRKQIIEKAESTQKQLRDNRFMTRIKLKF